MAEESVNFLKMKAEDREGLRLHYKRLRAIERSRLWYQQHKEWANERNRRYYWAHREEILEHHREYMQRTKIWRKPKHRAKAAQYKRENTTMLGEYLGPVRCCKCGRNGYLIRRIQFNKNTGHKCPPTYEVRHQYRKPGSRKIYYERCYPSRLEAEDIYGVKNE